MENSPVVVNLRPTSGQSAQGKLLLSQVKDGVRLRGEITGLKPGAEHGFHVHEKGDCSAPDASSAGGHFNPHGQAHGHYEAQAHHAGDLPALLANAQGLAKVDVWVRGLSIRQTADEADILGKALIVHRDPDDGSTQPTGNSGPRVACGVIAS